MTRIRLLLALVAALLALAAAPTAEPSGGAATAEAAPGRRTLRVLTIGNSFTGNATRYLGRIVEADGRFDLVLGKAWIGGSSMERHLQEAEAHEADPTKGKPYGGASLTEKLTEDKWDIVTIQQLSSLSDKVETYRPAADKLVALVRKHAPQADVWFHETWAYRADDKRFGEGRTQETIMYADLRAAYHQVARELGIRNIIPVGDAFQAARRHPKWQFKFPDPAFDYATAAYPALPDQTHSLCIGYQWLKQKDGSWKLNFDTHHANTFGEYLGACVWFERLFGASVVGNTFELKGVGAEDARLLQTIAHDTVAEKGNCVVAPAAEQTP